MKTKEIYYIFQSCSPLENCRLSDKVFLGNCGKTNSEMQYILFKTIKTADGLAVTS